MCSFANDSPRGNAIMKTIKYNRIGLFALKNSKIRIGDEITYSYDCKIVNTPWRKKLDLEFSFHNTGYTRVNNSLKFCSYCQNLNLMNVCVATQHTNKKNRIHCTFSS